MLAFYSNCQDQIVDVIDTTSTSKQNTNFALLQEESIKKKNIQRTINKLRKLYKLERQVIKKLIL